MTTLSGLICQLSATWNRATGITNDVLDMMTASQLRAARALAGLDQRTLALRSGLSVPTIQRMEASDGVVRGNVESLMKLIAALEDCGVVLIANDEASVSGGRGVRLKNRSD